MIKKELIFIVSFLLLGVFFLPNTLAIEQNYCCEKTVDGSVCQSAPITECAAEYAKQPTSCDKTAFCKLGTCVDQIEGRCLPNTPQVACEEIGGFWSQESVEDLAQCNLGCCFYGDQSAFTTQTRCSTLAGFYGLEQVYRSDINDEYTCLASAREEEMGACVFDENGSPTCKMLSKSECNDLRGSVEGNIKFNEGYLCSADHLGVSCGPSKNTRCVEDSAEVYFTDTCGNLANIYDESKWPVDKDPEYWNKIIPKEDSCGYGTSNANDPGCGNCEYLLGSMCTSKNDGGAGNPTYGNYICEDLSCNYKGQTYEHGEKWCATGEVEGASRRKNEGDSTKRRPSSFILSYFFTRSVSNSNTMEDVWTDYLPGTESYVLKCYNGQILKEPCSVGESRNKICQEEEVNGISNAGCIANMWSGCINQKTKEDCSSYDLGDCEWIEGYTLLSSRDQDTGKSLMEAENGNRIQASCVPKYSPAFDFWNGENANVDNLCSQAGDTCKVEYEFPVLVDRKDKDGNNMDDKLQRAKYCSKNCQCLEGYEAGMSKINKRAKYEKENSDKPWLLNYEDWRDTRNNVCFSLGDCGYSNNAFGLPGDWAEDDIITAEFFRKAKDFREEYEE